MRPQRDEAWVKKAGPEEIAAAQQAGELDQLLGRGEFYTAPEPQPHTDEERAAALGITVNELQHLDSPEVLAKMQAHFAKVPRPDHSVQ